MTLSEILVKLSDDFQFAFLNEIAIELTLKTHKKTGKKYCLSKINIPLEIEDLRDIREKYTIFLGILPKDKFEKELEEVKK